MFAFVYWLLFSVGAAYADYFPNQQLFADVDFEVTQAGRPRIIYEVVLMPDAPYVRTELGIFRIHGPAPNGRRFGEAILPSKLCRITKMTKHSKTELMGTALKGPTGREVDFTIDVTAPEPLQTFSTRK